MLNRISIDAVNANRFERGFVKPLYDSYGFANIPTSIKPLLTGVGQPTLPADVLGEFGRAYDAVVLFLVDGFGWRFFERYADAQPFLKHLMQNGIVSKLTSMFPSTTAAHVTCVHTGLPPAQSGVYEWFMYDPKLGETVAPLLFSVAGDKDRDTLARKRVPAEHLFPQPSLYQQLAACDVQSFVFQSNAFAHSPSSRVLNAGANTLGFKTLPQGLVQLGKALANRTGPSYYFFYWGDIDATCHEFGPHSEEFEAEVDHFFTALERHLVKRLAGQRVLFLMTADHGQIEVNPLTCHYLNVELPGLMKLLQRNRRGDPIMPSGSARDTFWHVQPTALDEACGVMADHLKDKALVCKTEMLVTQDFFGSQPSPLFLSRLGNLAVLPYAYETAWWFEKDKFEQRFFGHHGGLTPQEMEIPLLVGEF